MNPQVQKILERLNYEKLLISSQLVPRRNRLTLAQIYLAAQEEPRVFEVLPALALYKPQAIYKFSRDIKKYPDLENLIQNLFNDRNCPKKFCGIDTKDCQKAALTYKKFREHKELKQKSRTLTIRLGISDIQRLQLLTQKLKRRSVSDTIRYLAEEKEQEELAIPFAAT